MNPGAEAMTVVLSRPDSSRPWGFRLQGGNDFPIPLSIQMVNPGGVAELHGVKAGDSVLSINHQPTDALTHAQAKQMIVTSGNQIELLVQRGQVTIWKPQVTNLAPAQRTPVSGGSDEVYIQKTSLAAKPQEFLNIGASHNRSARPFGGFGGSSTANGTDSAAPPQYSAQPASDLFQNNGVSAPAAPSYQQQPQQQPAYSAQQGSMQQQQQDYGSQSYGQQQQSYGQQQQSYGQQQPQQSYTPQQPQQSYTPQQPQQSYTPQQPQQSYAPPQQQPAAPQSFDGQSAGGASRPTGTRSVKAPVTTVGGEKKAAEYMTCKACGSLIVGIFVKIKGEPLHPECFKCCECGMNLKNKGHFSIEGRLYCETHVRQAASTATHDAIPVYR